MADKKVYDTDEIMKMAVGLIEADVDNADYDGDGKVTAADARANKRIDSGLSVDTPVVGNTGVTGVTGSSGNPFAVSNAYQNQADAIYKRIQETPDFKYDFNEDAVFKALQEQYMKDGRFAAENIQGQAAALSGGYGNSYGATAAGQAYMSAVDSLYDIVPELEAQAYSRYQDKRNNELQNWEITQNRADKERTYAENERAYADSKTALDLEKALQLANIGDYSGLEALGIDPSYLKKQSELDFALAAAEFGDYSFLKSMGIDTSYLEAQKYSSGAGGSSGGAYNSYSENESDGHTGWVGSIYNKFRDVYNNVINALPDIGSIDVSELTALGISENDARQMVILNSQDNLTEEKEEQLNELYRKYGLEG